MHIDCNAYGACFVFAPKTYKGGALVTSHDSMPDVKCSHLIKAGDVIGGRFTRSPHCIDKYSDDEIRNVFVLYGEYRILEPGRKYKHVENENTNVVLNEK